MFGSSSSTTSSRWFRCSSSASTWKRLTSRAQVTSPSHEPPHLFEGDRLLALVVASAKDRVRDGFYLALDETVYRTLEGVQRFRRWKSRRQRGR